jgi:hypothetical protein
MECHMNRNLTFTSAVVVAALSLAAAPAGAQGRPDSGHQRGGGHATASAPSPQQDGARQAAPRQAPRENAPRASESRQSSGPQASPRAYDRGQSSGPQASPRAYDRGQSSGPQASPRAYDRRQYSGPQASPRAYDRGQYSGPQVSPRAYDNRQYQSQQRAVPRGYDGRSYQSRSYGNDSRRGYARPRSSYGEYYSRPHIYSRFFDRPYNYERYRPYYFSRPYYSFRPWMDFGFGLWLGYSVPYPYDYLGDYRPRVYGNSYPEGSYDVSPGAPLYGGVSFDIQPSDADLFVDGEYIGAIGTFTPNAEPLTLSPGQHRIAVQREGYRPLEWDVTVQPGQVIPYRGVMERY